MNNKIFLYEIEYSLTPELPADFYPITGELHHAFYYNFLNNLKVDINLFRQEKHRFFHLIIFSNKLIARTTNIQIGNKLIEMQTQKFQFYNKWYSLKNQRIRMFTPDFLFEPLKILQVETLSPILTHTSNIYNILVYIFLHLHKRWNTHFEKFLIEPEQIKNIPTIKYMQLTSKLINLKEKQSYPGYSGEFTIIKPNKIQTQLLKLGYFIGIGLKRSYGFGAIKLKF